MPFSTAAQKKIQRLYHWQRFELACFEEQIKNGTVYCSTPRYFNDPWDCRPFFNTNLLADENEQRKQIEWAVDICKRDPSMSSSDIQKMSRELRNPEVLEHYVRKHTVALQEEVLKRYRVYCLCPDVKNMLMWAHYANKHSGVCLEFNVQSETICGALEVQYRDDFPMTNLYSNDESENLLPLLAKARAWEYEHEYRLIAQDADHRTPHDTLLAKGGHLELSKGALLSVIVGHLGPYEQVKTLTMRYRPEIQVLRAHLVPNRYELDIRA
jgi:hypothetical protein